MKKQFEHFLLSVLLGTSVLLVLTFWLNIKFGFNCLSASHWMELASLQASQNLINKDFYLSIGVAIGIFIFGLYIINRPRLRKISINQQTVIEETPVSEQIKQPEIKPVIQTKEPVTEQPLQPYSQDTSKNIPPVNNTQTNINMVRPPKLNLPKNIAQLAAAQYGQQAAQENKSQQMEIMNEQIAKIFTDNNYVVKKNAVFGDLTTNLFAIGNNEKLWIGVVDSDIKLLESAMTQLKNVFKETLEDIEINTEAFLIDSLGRYTSVDDIKVFHNIEELNEFISKNPGDTIEDYDRENFDAYSEYIDTVITMLYNSKK